LRVSAGFCGSETPGVSFERTSQAQVTNPPNFIPGSIFAKNIEINTGRLLNSGWISAENDLDIWRM
jgi:hypothetical protein